MTRVTICIWLVLTVAALLLVPGCNDSAVESDGEDICLYEENYEWFTPCESEGDCCLGDDPLCQVVPAVGEEKVCTRECTTAPEDEPIEGQCCTTSQEHNCGNGCCMVNYIEPPDGGTSNSGYGIGTCVPE
jgi:hypothetical protein